MKKLLCYFIEDDGYEKHLTDIFNLYSPKKIFLFGYLDKYFVTFNSDKFIKNRNLIILNRNSHTNTLYTLNGLNNLILSITGNYDEMYQINWNNYRNQFIISRRKNTFELIDLDLKKIIHQ